MKINSKKNKIYRYILPIAVIALLGTGVVYYAYSLNQPDPTESTSVNDASSRVDEEDATDKDKEVTSEDIPESSLPESVNPEDIKNYTTLVENEKYKVRKLNNDYVVTLYAIINNPNQYDTYIAQLRQYKQEALDYMKSKDIDTTKVKITYEPNEATNL